MPHSRASCHLVLNTSTEFGLGKSFAWICQEAHPFTFRDFASSFGFLLRRLEGVGWRSSRDWRVLCFFFFLLARGD
jgi:hypothetical protein